MSKVYVNPTHPFAEAELRTALAAEAMAGLLANHSMMVSLNIASKENSKLMMAGAACFAVEAADALIAELNK